MKEVDLGEPTSFFDHVYLGCIQRECQTSKDIVDNQRNMFGSKIFARAEDKLPFSEKRSANISSWSHDEEGHAKNVWSDVANWRTEQVNSYTKSQLHALTTISLKKKWDLLESCQKYALKLF